MKLEKLVEEIMPLHESAIKARNPKISIPVQMSLTNTVPLSVTKRSTLMGRFYEHINRALYGGTLNDERIDVSWENGECGEESIKPDVIDHEGRIVWESKACCSGHSCNIMNRQLDGYRYIQYYYPDAEVFFSLYRHSLKGIKSEPTEKLSEEDIVQELIVRTLFSVVLPLGIILRLQEIPNSQGINHARLYEGGKEWPDCLVINPKTIDRFLSDPEQNLRYLDLDPSNYIIERYRSPGNLAVNRKRIKPFPVVRILYRDHWEWVDGFMEDHGADMESLREDMGKLPLFAQDSDIPF